jgi:UDP-N-acetylglucosamine transferase subunit ALG13
VIFVTVGTHQQPFQRLIEALSALPADELVVQYGYAEPPPGVARSVAFMSFPEMLEHFERADAVITHAGVGSILCAANAGHVPAVVPRLRRHGEHVDDHQLQLVDQLEHLGYVRVVTDVGDLAAVVSTLPPKDNPRARLPGPLQQTVHAALRGGLEPEASERRRPAANAAQGRHR